MPSVPPPWHSSLHAATARRLAPTGLACRCVAQRTILRALEEYVDIECEEQIDVSINVDPSVGTVYCVAVPIRKVRRGRAGAAREAGGGAMMLCLARLPAQSVGVGWSVDAPRACARARAHAQVKPEARMALDGELGDIQVGAGPRT